VPTFLPEQDFFHPPVLQFCRREKEKHDIFICLR
jgi:hypothetical protein